MSRIFSDLDLNFGKHPITKDVSRKINDNAVINSIKNLIMTNYNERAFNPKLGSNITAMLFEPLDMITAGILRSEIQILIDNFEPRVSVSDIKVNPDYDRDGFDVSITFSIVNNLSPIIVGVFLQRLR